MQYKKSHQFLAGLIFILLYTSFSHAQEPLPQQSELIIFYSPSCHNCLKIKEQVLPGIEREFASWLKLVYLDITDIQNYQILLGLREKHEPALNIDLPVFYFCGRFLNGQDALSGRLAVFIRDSQLRPARDDDFTPRPDLFLYFKKFGPVAVSGAGLVDGINPCAFTVIVFFISFLALQGYRKRQLLFIGSSFILAVFLTYLLLGLGLFGFLYRLRGFWVIIKVFNFSVGVFSILLGLLALYDFFKFKKTASTDTLVLQLPRVIKEKIHFLIGSRYRKTGSDKDAPSKEKFFSLVIGAFTMGFLVSLLEAICTGQMYLPTIAFVLKTTLFKLPALGYLLLYNFMFVIPLIFIFLLSLTGATSVQFARFLKKYLPAIKIMMAVLFFVMGIFLVRRA